MKQFLHLHKAKCLYFVSLHIKSRNIINIVGNKINMKYHTTNSILKTSKRLKDTHPFNILKSRPRKNRQFANGVHRCTNFQDMTMTRWWERGLGADWSKKAATGLIGWRILGGKFRLAESPDGGKWMTLSGAQDLENCLARLAYTLFTE